MILCPHDRWRLQRIFAKKKRDYPSFYSPILAYNRHSQSYVLMRTVKHAIRGLAIDNTDGDALVDALDQEDQMRRAEDEIPF